MDFSTAESSHRRKDASKTAPTLSVRFPAPFTTCQFKFTRFSKTNVSKSSSATTNVREGHPHLFPSAPDLNERSYLPNGGVGATRSAIFNSPDVNDIRITYFVQTEINKDRTYSFRDTPGNKVNAILGITGVLCSDYQKHPLRFSYVCKLYFLNIEQNNAYSTDERRIALLDSATSESETLVFCLSIHTISQNTNQSNVTFYQLQNLTNHPRQLRCLKFSFNMSEEMWSFADL
jgi:hypothetical protein